MAIPIIRKNEIEQSHKLMEGLSLDSQRLHFSDDEIIKAWEELDPYDHCEGKEIPKKDPYKNEKNSLRKKRFEKGKTNFPNIGGNPATRVTPDDDSFVEGSRISPCFIATGYPTVGAMRENYWKMVSAQQKTHTVFIANFMTESEVNGYGGWYFNAEEMKERKFLMIVLNHMDPPINLYHYPFWKDHGDGDREVVAEIIRQIYVASLASTKPPLIIANCRAGVGRTGTFANLFHFYQKMKEVKELRQEDFSMHAIIENVKAFRRERGDQQFVQTQAQFVMLCKMVEHFFNEEIDKRQG